MNWQHFPLRPIWTFCIHGLLLSMNNLDFFHSSLANPVEGWVEVLPLPWDTWQLATNKFSKSHVRRFFPFWRCSCVSSIVALSLTGLMSVNICDLFLFLFSPSQNFQHFGRSVVKETGYSSIGLTVLLYFLLLHFQMHNDGTSSLGKSIRCCEIIFSCLSSGDL